LSINSWRGKTIQTQERWRITASTWQ
jgi:hypothetical protein